MDYRQRLAWIAELNRMGLRCHRRDGLRLELIYALGVRAGVQAMVERERTCCAFLAFDIQETTEDIRVTILAPEAVRGSVDHVFAPFLARPVVS